MESTPNSQPDLPSELSQDFEESCPACHGRGRDGYHSCSICGGTGYTPTELGEKILSLVRHNLGSMLQVR